jgi:hypothetical protein
MQSWAMQSWAMQGWAMQGWAMLGWAILAIAAVTGSGAASAQTPAAGRICRGVLSVNADNRQFGFIWVRVNADDSGDAWSAPGRDIAPDAIPPAPPADAKHTFSKTISHFPNGYVGIGLQLPRGSTVTMMVNEDAKTLSTPRQHTALACSP